MILTQQEQIVAPKPKFFLFINYELVAKENNKILSQEIVIILGCFNWRITVLFKEPVQHLVYQSKWWTLRPRAASSLDVLGFFLAMHYDSLRDVIGPEMTW